LRKEKRGEKRGGESFFSISISLSYRKKNKVVLGGGKEFSLHGYCEGEGNFYADGEGKGGESGRRRP